MLLQLLMYTFIIQKKIVLSNNNVHKLIGTGPPVVFCSAINGRLPYFMYSNFINCLKQNMTVVLPNTKEMMPETIEEISKVLNVEKVGFISHSMVNPVILTSEYIEKAVCIDPLSLPHISFPLQIETTSIRTKFDTLVINTQESFFLSNPMIDLKLSVEDASNMQYENYGHMDIMDDFWANYAKNFGFKSTNDFDSEEMQSFENWKFTKHKKQNNRENFRQMIYHDSVSHIIECADKQSNEESNQYSNDHASQRSNVKSNQIIDVVSLDDT